MNFHNRIESLEQERDDDPALGFAEWKYELANRKHEAAVRIDELLRDARPDQIPGLNEMIGQADDKPPKFTPLHMWVSSVALGDSVIPADLNPVAIQCLVDHLLGDDPIGFFAVCDGCGLARWSLKSRLGAGETCLHCRSPSWTWETRLDEVVHPWRTTVLPQFGSDEWKVFYKEKYR